MSEKNWLEELHWTKDHTDELRQTAFSYIRQGKYATALPFFEALVILDPNNTYDLQTLGALYVQMNQAQKAIKTLNNALVLDGEHGPTLLNLTKAFFMAGKIDEGRRLATILQKDPDIYISGNASALLMCYS